MVLFVSANSSDRDLENQAIFKKDNLYSVRDKIVSGFYSSNKKVKISQVMPNEVKDYVIVNVLISDYYKIHSQELLIFVVGQTEIISNEFYVYAKDVNCVDVDFIFKENSLKVVILKIFHPEGLVNTEYIEYGTHDFENNEVSDFYEKESGELAKKK
ncbi:10140_t:CDS:2, partial [Racocetra persica]